MSDSRFESINNATLLSIHDLLGRYRKGGIHLPHLANELDALISGLVEADASLVESLKAQWRVVEEVNAVALDQGLISPPGDCRDILDRAIERIGVLVAPYLGAGMGHA